MKNTTPDNKRRTITRGVGLLALLVVAASLTACNATKGLGQDLEESSNNVKNAGK